MRLLDEDTVRLTAGRSPRPGAAGRDELGRFGLPEVIRTDRIRRVNPAAHRHGHPARGGGVAAPSQATGALAGEGGTLCGGVRLAVGVPPSGRTTDQA
jgi:hypothetical protein